jgi:oligogalacturonide transporter
MALKVAFVMAGYIFYNTVTTLVLVPYSSLAAEVTLDYNERNSVNTVRMMFSLGSSLMCAILPLAIVKAVSTATGSYARGYFVMALAIGLVFALPYVAVTLGAKERVDFQRSPSKDFGWKLMKDSFRVRSFRKLVVIYLTVFVSLDLITTSFQFYMTYVLDRPDDFSAVLGILIVVEILAALITAPIANRIGKKAATISGCALWIAVGLSTLLLSKSNSSLIYPIAALMGVAMAFPVVLLNSLFADVTDVGELYFGRRMEGTFSGVQTFVRKCASALANALFLASLGWAGFVAPVKTVRGLAESYAYQAQPESLQLLIRATIAFAPALLLGIGIFVAWSWPISAERHAKLLTYLEAKRGGALPEAALAAEMEALRGPIL